MEMNKELNPKFMDGLMEFHDKLRNKDKNTMLMMNSYYKELIPMINRMGYTTSLKNILLEMDKINKTMDQVLVRDLFKVFYNVSPDDIWIYKD